MPEEIPQRPISTPAPIMKGGSQSPPPAPPGHEPEAPPMGPLTPVFLVWPRKTFSQTWVFAWIGVAFIMAGLMPWSSQGDDLLIQKDGSIITRNVFRQEQLVAEASQAPVRVREFISWKKPGMPLGALLVLFCGLGLLLNGAKNIWTRKLIFWPVTLALFTVLCVLWFTSAMSPDPGHETLIETSVFSQIGDLLSNFSGLWAKTADPAHAAFWDTFARFGAGLYLALFAWIFLVAVIGGSLLIAILTAGKKDGARAPGKARGKRRA